MSGRRCLASRPRSVCLLSRYMPPVAAAAGAEPSHTGSQSEGRALRIDRNPKRCAHTSSPKAAPAVSPLARRPARGILEWRVWLPRDRIGAWPRSRWSLGVQSSEELPFVLAIAFTRRPSRRFRHTSSGVATNRRWRHSSSPPLTPPDGHPMGVAGHDHLESLAAGLTALYSPPSPVAGPTASDAVTSSCSAWSSQRIFLGQPPRPAAASWVWRVRGWPSAPWLGILPPRPWPALGPRPPLDALA